MNWLDAGGCKIHLDMHCPDWDDEILARFDARAIVDSVAKCGSDALYFFAKDCYGNAYYATSMGQRHRSMGERDFLAEVCSEAAKRELPIVAYYSVIWDNHAASEYPEWTLRDPAGRALSDTVTSDLGKWCYLCHNSPYRDYAAAMIREIAQQYPVAGLHLDMFNMDFGGISCHCTWCQEAYLARTGEPLPVEATWDDSWRRFLEFRYDSVERLMCDLRDAARHDKPGLPVVMNFHGAPNFDWRVGQLPFRHSLPSTMGTGETYTPMFGDLYPGMEGRFLRSLAPQRPFEMVSWRMTRITDFTLKSRPQLRWEVFTGLLHGGSAMLIDQPFADGTLDQVAYDRIGEVFQEAAEMRPSLRGEFVPQAALYFSAKTRDWYGRDEQSRFIVPLTGAYKALVESHCQVEFLFDETVDRNHLTRYPVVVLPNTAILTAKESESLRDYVRAGGCLIATFDSSRYDEDGRPLPNFDLRDVFGVEFVDTLDCDNVYFRGLQPPLSGGVDPRQYVLCNGPAHVVRPTTAVGYGDLHQAFHKRRVPQHFFSHNIHPPHDRIGAALFVNRFGNGTCIYLPFGLDHSYGDMFELPEHRQVLGALLSELAPAPFVEITAPLNCEVVLRRDSRRLYAILTMFAPVRQNAALPTLNRPVRPSLRMEEPPCFQASFRVRQPFIDAAVIHGTAKIEIDGARVAVHCTDVYALVAIDLEEDE